MSADDRCRCVGVSSTEFSTQAACQLLSGRITAALEPLHNHSGEHRAGCDVLVFKHPLRRGVSVLEVVYKLCDAYHKALLV
jgi:hypothetical protein